MHHTAGTNGYSAAEVPEDPAGDLRLPRQGQRLVRRRLQLPRRPLRPALGGPLRRHRPARSSARTPAASTSTRSPSPRSATTTRSQPAAAMVDSIARLMAWKLGDELPRPQRHDRPDLRRAAGRRGTPRARKVTFNNISGHRDAGKTSCPGNNLYAQLATIRALTTSYMGTAMYNPTALLGHRGLRHRLDGHRLRARQHRPAVAARGARRLPHAPWCARSLGTASPSVRAGRRCGTCVTTPGPRSDPVPTRCRSWAADAGGSTPTWALTVTVNPARTAPPAVAAASPPGAPASSRSTRSGCSTPRVDGGLPLGPGQRLDLRVPGVGRVPETGVAAVALNVSAGCATARPPVTVWATGSKQAVVGSAQRPCRRRGIRDRPSPRSAATAW